MQQETPHTDLGLLRSIAAGDMQAYQQLFQRYWDLVYSIGLRLTKSPDQAKDLAQDIFLKIWDKKEKLPEVRDFRSYLYTIAKNRIHDQIRSRIFHESNREFLENYFDYTESSPQQLLEGKEMKQVLEVAISRLPEQLRQVINLRRWEKLSHQEIAIKLNISRQSSKTYMVRALIALRKEITRHKEELLFITSLFFSFF
ncbi:MAG TPA: RNA polymerase sigma-70 factor [Puia sp.]|jgi:RNA polymerase sigma-70 factor (ECF subfamily)|nr:RNA polymerase sigma-70 factor [Puia sp.]